MKALTLHQYRPGIEDEVVLHHTSYYGEHWGFDERFCAQVRRELGEFIKEFDRERDCFWWAARGGGFAGSIAVDGSRSGVERARIRWFIVPEAFQGAGVGGVLLDQAMQFCRSRHFQSVHLWTFEGLDSARTLYERHGFRLGETASGTDWGTPVIEQKFELVL